MSKVKTSTSIAVGFIAGVSFLIGCGGGSVNNAIAETQTFWKNVGTTIFYTDGNVGIGTSTPESKLQINDGSVNLLQVVGNNGLHVDSDRLTRFNAQNSVKEGGHIELQGAGIFQDWVIDTYSGNLRFFEPFPSRQTSGANRGDIIFGVNPGTGTSEASGINALTIKKSGNIGIGTMSPKSKLSVVGLPTSPPDTSGNAGIVCATNSGNFWLDNDGTPDCN